jgi:hypothetical protein
MESYHVSNKIRETSKRRPLFDPGWSVIGKRICTEGEINANYS